MVDLSFVPRMDELAIKAEPKPTPDSGRLERRKNRAARKQGLEPETHAEKLARVEFWRVMRLEVWTRDHGVCRACQLALDLDAPKHADNALHCHHVIHKSAGGLDVIENLCALCKGCHKLHHDGRLTIVGEAMAVLSMTLRTLKGIVKRVWESPNPSAEVL